MGGTIDEATVGGVVTVVGDAFPQLAGDEVNLDGAKDVSFVVMLVEVVPGSMLDDGNDEVWEATTGNIDADEIGEFVWADDFDNEDGELVSIGTKY